MTNDVVLEAIKTLFLTEVASKIELKNSAYDPTDPESKEYVNPNVFIGYIPPKNYLPNGFDVPCIVVGMGKGTDSDDDTSLSVRVTFITYDDGDVVNGETIPSMNGYRDVLSLIDRSRLCLAENPIILGKCSVNKPIDWELYEEIVWPMWYGAISFNCTVYTLQMNDL